MELVGATRVTPQMTIDAIVRTAVDQITIGKNPTNIMLLDLTPKTDGPAEEEKKAKTAKGPPSSRQLAAIEADKQMQTVEAAAAKPVDTASHINLSGLRIGVKNCSPISRAMILNRSVMVLDLSVCDLGDAGCEELVACLARNSTLEQLSLNGNFLTAASATCLAEYLLVAPRLNALSVACNDIGDAGALALSKVLPYNEPLTFLNVRGNAITDVGARALLDAIRKQPPPPPADALPKIPPALLNSIHSVNAETAPRRQRMPLLKFEELLLAKATLQPLVHPKSPPHPSPPSHDRSLNSTVNATTSAASAVASPSKTQPSSPQRASAATSAPAPPDLFEMTGSRINALWVNLNPISPALVAEITEELSRRCPPPPDNGGKKKKGGAAKKK
jgi:hypothetical protein